MKYGKYFLLQDRIHTYLDLFLNGYSLTKIGKVAYPLVDSNVNNFRGDILPLLGEGFEESAKLIRDSGKTLSSREFSEIISTLYTEFYDKPLKIKTSTKKIKKIRSFDEWDRDVKDKQFLKPIYEIKRICHNIDILGFYLHGSLSTLDYIKGWSDADTLMILKRGTVEDPKKLLRLRKQTIKIVKKLFEIDYHQLHGCFVVCEEDMSFYSQSYFPLELFKYSTIICGSRNLVFKLRDDRLEKKNVFEGFVKYLKNAEPKNSMEWKEFYHFILLLPCIYLQAKGKHVYKRDSFGLVGKEFNKKDLKVLERVTWIMNNWFDYKLNKSRFLSPFIVGFFAKRRKLPKRVASLNKVMKKEAISLALIMEDKLKKGGYL